jgi:hypothetical protein
MGIIGRKFGIGALAGVAGTGATMLIAWLLPASLSGYIVGAISGGVGGGISTIGYNLLAGQPWRRNLAGGILLGTVSGGIAGSLTPVRPGPKPKMSWNRGWPLAGSYVGKKSIDVVLEEVTQDVIGAFLAITSSSYADAPLHNNNLPVYQYWEPR